MAYLNWLASVPVAAIPNLKSIAEINQHATAISPCSHLIVSWVAVQPLGRLLGETPHEALSPQPVHRAIYGAPPPRPPRAERLK